MREAPVIAQQQVLVCNKRNIHFNQRKYEHYNQTIK
jgi:hypothetical protein